jgi:hypothetical protein
MCFAHLQWVSGVFVYWGLIDLTHYIFRSRFNFLSWILLQLELDDDGVVGRAEAGG